MLHLKPGKYLFSLWETFIKAQISSIIATIIDWAITFMLTEWIKIWYVISSFTGAVSGGVVNFLLNKYWTFNPDKNKKRNIQTIPLKQVFRYMVVWSGSILLNTTGTVVFTEIISLNYMLAKMITAILVAVSFNFYLQKNYVFRLAP